MAATAAVGEVRLISPQGFLQPEAWEVLQGLEHEFKNVLSGALERASAACAGIVAERLAQAAMGLSTPVVVTPVISTRPATRRRPAARGGCGGGGACRPARRVAAAAAPAMGMPTTSMAGGLQGSQQQASAKSQRQQQIARGGAAARSLPAIVPAVGEAGTRVAAPPPPEVIDLRGQVGWTPQESVDNSAFVAAERPSRPSRGEKEAANRYTSSVLCRILASRQEATASPPASACPTAVSGGVEITAERRVAISKYTKSLWQRAFLSSERQQGSLLAQSTAAAASSSSGAVHAALASSCPADEADVSQLSLHPTAKPSTSQVGETRRRAVAAYTTYVCRRAVAQTQGVGRPRSPLSRYVVSVTDRAAQRARSGSSRPSAGSIQASEEVLSAVAPLAEARQRAIARYTQYVCRRGLAAATSLSGGGTDSAAPSSQALRRARASDVSSYTRRLIQRAVEVSRRAVSEPVGAEVGETDV
eukprot:TRINITY_DN22680_c0_g1_i1.p1 TRINITY_DN22680_c0_g1~~TRINITY_DN22680_c0_g1_i1.p1  ORF type:complete len:505 (+),score=90.17 TRINITY_DN22680_c0_g1_i1:88-1515(+)